MARTYARVVIFTPLLEGMLRGPEAKGLVEAGAERGADAARESAPVNTGDYRDSIRAFPANMTVDGWEASFGSIASDWHFIEFGTATNPPYATLRNAVERAGLGARVV